MKKGHHPQVFEVDVKSILKLHSDLLSHVKRNRQGLKEKTFLIC